MTFRQELIDEIPDDQLSPKMLYPEAVRRMLKDLPDEILCGERPEMFAREMTIGFY